MPKRRIQGLIAETMGLKAESISEENWEKILRERMALSGMISLEAYYHLIQTSPQELQEFIERLIVPETWFFRDKSAFDLLVQTVRLASHRMRILSLACASGEEPYSMAIALKEARIPADRYQIDAADISKTALLQAETALYTSHSFRGKGAEVRERFFDKVDNRYLLKKEVRDQVRFSYGNICHPQFAEGKPLYDVIFLRNLLIYLHPQAQKRVLQNCAKLLAPGGLLVSTPVEASIVVKHGFVMNETGRAFMLHKPAAQRTVRAAHVKSVEAKQVETKRVASLQAAREAADSGKFEEAEALCRDYLQQEVMDAEAHFLLGAIHHARGNEKEAEACFLKTIYLQPRHEEALFYLALLSEMRGDQKLAAQFRRRLKK